ncbi:hypothetical protein EZS27_005311 [termite gut metagenome]|uniref:GLUG domain-containing protein n=1 Tax=termite gut metagenome TaxID=433724 RepID=A0A5J4SM33_9ZZZZ
MKKSMIFPAILLLLFAGCSERENGIDYNNEEIRIVSKFGPVTRGEGPIATFSSLNVGFARLDQQGSDWKWKSSQLDGIVNGSTKVLSFSPVENYPSDKSQKVRLTGWYPRVVSAEYFDSSTGKVTFPEIDGSTDIMVTEMVEGSQDVKFTGITFYHILSQVTVKAYVEDADAADTWGKIQSVKILGKKQGFTLTLPTETGNKPNAVPDGTDKLPLSDIDTHDDISPLDLSTAIGTGLAKTLGTAMFAPGDHTTDKLQIEIGTEKKGTVIAKVSNNFAEGTSYTITLKFNKNGESAPAEVAIEPTVTVSPWINGTNPVEVGVAVPTDATITVLAYADQTIEVTLIDDDEATESAGEPEIVSVPLDEIGTGSLYIGDKVIKSIQKVSGGTPILIGRKKAGEDKITVVLNVDAAHKVQWRTKESDATTALIGTAAELLLRFNAPNTVTTYEFESDIDLVGEEWVPVEELSSGVTVDGQHHKIYGLIINSAATAVDFLGLFNACSGIIQNLHIKSGAITVNINSSTSGGGGVFVGELKSNGQIIGCSNSIPVNGRYSAGICGRLTEGSIIGCVNHGAITGSTGIGGICYYHTAENGIIKACYNTGSITSSGTPAYTGGIVGRFNTDANRGINACYNIGSISTTSSSAVTSMGPINGHSTSKAATVKCYHSASSYTGALPASANASKAFSQTNWPNKEDENWDIGNDPTTGKYWKNLGNQKNNPSPTDFPKLYWEED